MVENHVQHPVNAYGDSKLMVERILKWYGEAYGLKWTILRYFNAAGADPEGELGEVHNPETHLIPRGIAAAHGDLIALDVFGTDYDTPDGTAVRDYLHVADLASAHLKALVRLAETARCEVFNLGAGRGHSVREVISTIEKVSGRIIPVRECPRRPGDPPVLVADSSRASQELGWAPNCSSLEEIVSTAWQWYTSAERRAETSTSHRQRPAR
jgi:UDP-glucose-4-epimerase GalE